MNKRNTVQRSLVLDAVRGLRAHATADEVYATIKKSRPNIGRGTVYRNLGLLADMGEIGKVEMLGGPARYDHLRHEHYHAKCVKCGHLFDMEMEVIAGLEKSITNARGFEVTGHDIIFRGICPECNK